MRAAIHLADHLHEAPVLLFVAGWTRRGQPQTQALFPAVQNLLLACRAVGLGVAHVALPAAPGGGAGSPFGRDRGIVFEMLGHGGHDYVHVMVIAQ